MALVRVLNKQKCSLKLTQRCIAQVSTMDSSVQFETSQSVKPFKDIPGPKGIYSWPVLGPMMLFKPFGNKSAVQASSLFTEMLDKYGPIVKLQLSRPTVLISDPKDAETVFRNEGKYPVSFKTELTEVYAERNNFKYTISDLNGESWYNLRAPLNKQLMRADSATHYLPQQGEVADEFVNILANQKLNPAEISDLFFRFTAESIGIVCFNARSGFLDPILMQDKERTEFLHTSKDVHIPLHQSLFGDSIAHKWYRNKTYREFERSNFIIRKYTQKHIEAARQVLRAREEAGTLNPDEPNLLLSMLSDESLEYEDIWNTMQSLYTAGTDSTAKNLICFFYNLATNPDKQMRLKEEIDHVIGQNRSVTASNIEAMPYLKASIKESFRLINPTVSGPGRYLSTDVVLSGYQVPKGVFIQIHNPKTSKEYFEQPDKFIPERWLRASEMSIDEKIPNLATLPFGFGPRNCIGRRFALQEMYLATVKTLQKLFIEIAPESMKTEFIHALFVKPAKPINFKFTKLNV